MAPSIDEITAISAGRNSKRQIYRLPGKKKLLVFYLQRARKENQSMNM